MKYYLILLFVSISACIINKNATHSIKKLKVLSVDSIRDYFVFKTQSRVGNIKIVLAEKIKIEQCKPFKRFIIEDSIYRISAIKNGSRYDLVGFSMSLVDGIKIRDSGELVKVIRNCNSFVDK